MCSAKVTVNESPKNLEHKRRKTDESIINDSIMSNDPFNEAHYVSSCAEDEIIDSTPKPDATRRNLPKKIAGFKSPYKQQHQIKVEKFDDSTGDKGSKDEALLDAQQIKVANNPQSPLRSVENQHTAGKENRQVKNPSKWIANVMISPSRVNRYGFISAKSPRGKSRLSLTRTPMQSTILDYAKKPAKETVVDVSLSQSQHISEQIDLNRSNVTFPFFFFHSQTCAETYFDGTPRRPISETKGKFLRQQCLE